MEFAARQDMRLKSLLCGRLFDLVKSAINDEVRALGDKHRPAMLVIDDGCPFADVLSWQFAPLHSFKVVRRCFPTSLVGLWDLALLRFCVVTHQVCPHSSPFSSIQP